VVDVVTHVIGDEESRNGSSLSVKLHIPVRPRRNFSQEFSFKRWCFLQQAHWKNALPNRFVASDENVTQSATADACGHTEHSVGHLKPRKQECVFYATATIGHLPSWSRFNAIVRRALGHVDPKIFSHSWNADLDPRENSTSCLSEPEFTWERHLVRNTLLGLQMNVKSVQLVELVCYTLMKTSTSRRLSFSAISFQNNSRLPLRNRWSKNKEYEAILLLHCFKGALCWFCHFGDSY